MKERDGTTNNLPRSSMEDRDCDQGNRARDTQEKAESMRERIHKLLVTNVNLVLRHRMFLAIARLVSAPVGSGHAHCLARMAERTDSG